MLVVALAEQIGVSHPNFRQFVLSLISKYVLIFQNISKFQFVC